jgi:2-phosphoglycerate kinase
MSGQKHILIGGAPTTGKSIISKKLAQHYNLPFISTDQLRATVKPYGDPERFPTLYGATGMSAEEFLTRYTVQEISDMEFEQGKDVWPAVRALLEPNTDWHRGCVIEGVNILPKLVAQLDVKNNSSIKPVFLVDLDEERMRKVVYERGLYEPAENYSDDVKEIEVEWAMMFAHRLQREALECGFPCVEVTKSDNDISNIIEVIES